MSKTTTRRSFGSRSLRGRSSIDLRSADQTQAPKHFVGGTTTSRDLTKIYSAVEVRDGNSELMAIDVATKVATTVATLGKGASQVALSRDGNTLVATNSADGTVSIVDLGTGSTTSVQLVEGDPGTMPWNIALDHTRPIAYVSSMQPKLFTVYLDGSAPVGSISCDVVLSAGLAISPDGSSLWACSMGGSTSRVTIIQTSDWTNSSTHRFGLTYFQPSDVVFSHDGKTAFVSSLSGVSGTSMNTAVFAINTETLTVEKNIQFTTADGGVPILSMSPDGATLYASHVNAGYSTVTPIDVPSWTAKPKITMPGGMANLTQVTFDY